jgi:hypothetical protein
MRNAILPPLSALPLSHRGTGSSAVGVRLAQLGGLPARLGAQG